MSFLKKNAVTLILVATAIAFLVIGVGRGEVETVFRKAVNICMECIGLG